MDKSRIIMTVSTVAIGVVVVAWWVESSGRSQAVGAHEVSSEGEPVPTVEPGTDPASSAPAETEDLSSTAQRDPAVRAEPLADVEAQAAERAFDSCRAAIEESIFGRVDVNAFLDAALIATQEAVDKRVIVESDGTAELRFPLPGTPAGVDAEFRICQGTGVAPRILAVTMRMTPRASPYLLDAAVRKGCEARLQVWATADGELLDFVVQTTASISERETEQALGIPWDKGTVVEGVLYHFKLSDPAAYSLKAHGIIEGQPRDWRVDGTLRSSPRLESVHMLGERLLGMYNEVEKHSGEVK